jgi:hypothetical protein
MDTDGNGVLSWDEIAELSKFTLQKLLPESDDDYLEDLSETFTKFVFEACGIDYTVARESEISVELLKDVIAKDGEGVDLLLMMCCADNNPDVTTFEEKIYETGKNLEAQVQKEQNIVIENFKEAERKFVPKYLVSDDKYIPKAVQRKSIMQNFNMQFENMNNKKIEIEPNLEVKIQNLVTKKRRESHIYLDERAVLEEARLVTRPGLF